MATKYWIGVLLLALLTSSIYVLLPDRVRIDVTKTRTSYRVFENGEFKLAAMEYVNLFDGSAKMRAKSRSLYQIVEGTIITITRTAQYKDNISTYETYTFDGSKDDVELVPIAHDIICVNCKGKIPQFEYKSITYNGETKAIESPFSFGHQMKLEWQEGYDWAKVYQYKTVSPKIRIRYRPESDFESYQVRLFDPESIGEPTNETPINTTPSYNESHEWIYEPENKTWIIIPKDEFRGGGDSIEPTPIESKVSSGKSITINSFKTNPILSNFKVTLDNGLRISDYNWGVTIRPSFILNNGNVLTWSQLPPNINKTLWKTSNKPSYVKYGADFCNITEAQKNLMADGFLNLSIVSSENLTWNNIRRVGSKIIINQTIETILSFDDLLANYTINNLNKRGALINIRDSNFIPSGDGTYCIFFDPSVEIDVSDIISTSLLEGTRAEGGNFTHLEIDDSDDVYLEFDGDGDYISVTDDDSLDLSTAATWSLWVKRAQYTSLGGLLNKYFSAGGRRSYTLLESNVDSTEIGLFLSPNGATPDVYYTTNNCGPVDDEWTYIAVTYDEGSAIYYKNGVQCDTDSGSVTSIHPSSEPLLIGSSYDSDFNGLIDEVRIYNISLNQANISEIFNSGRVANSSLTSTGLVGWWKFDEGVGVSADDSSPEGNDGTLVGDTSWSTWGIGDNLVGYWSFDGDAVNTKLTQHYDFTSNDNDGTGFGDAVVNSSGCKFGDCAHFDGSPTDNPTHYIDVGQMPEFDNQLSNNLSFSVSAWIKPKPSSGTNFETIWNKFNVDGIRCDLRRNGVLRCLMYGDSANELSGSYAISRNNNWVHVVWTYNIPDPSSAGNFTIYVNGTQAVSSSETPGNMSNAGNFHISYAIVGSVDFNGSIDEVMVFNVSLTPTQILAIYNNQSARFVKTGTQKVRAVPITNSSNWNGADYDRVNLTVDYQANLKSQLSARIGQINLSVNSSGLVLYMPMEWGSAVDISGNENDGTLEGDAFINDSGLNDTKGLQLDGNGDYVGFGDEAHNFGSIQTISLWFKPSSFDNYDRIYASDSENNQIITIGVHSNNLTFTNKNNIDWLASSIELQTNVWQHLVVVTTDNQTTAKMYINGVDRTGSETGDGFGASTLTNLGCRNAGISCSTGIIDEFMIFNRNLSAQEVSNLYNNQSGAHHVPYYTPYQNLTTNPTNFSINTGADFLFPDFLFHAGNSSNPFYTPILNGSVTLETWNFTDEVAEDTDPPTYSDFADNSTASTPTNSTDVQLNVTITDSTAVDWYRIATNNTDGNAMTNQTIIDAGETSPITAIFNESIAWFPTTGGTLGWQIWSNDTLGNAGVSAMQTVTIRSIGDTCTTGLTDGIFDCADNCNIGTLDLLGLNFLLTGDGTFRGNISNYSNKTITSDNSCIAWTVGG